MMHYEQSREMESNKSEMNKGKCFSIQSPKMGREAPAIVHCWSQTPSKCHREQGNQNHQDLYQLQVVHFGSNLKYCA